jgi:hypothetical protein
MVVIAQVDSYWLPFQWLKFDLKSGHVGYVVAKVALGWSRLF